MFRIILLLLLVVPILEIWLLVVSGQTIGWLLTLLFVILTGVGGAALAKQQGSQVLRLAQLQLQKGQIPGEAILDGISIFAGGLLLLTPGFFTDAIGFALLIPYTRGIVKIGMKKWIARQIQNGHITFFFKK